jgi:hypothetical protein
MTAKGGFALGNRLAEQDSSRSIESQRFNTECTEERLREVTEAPGDEAPPYGQEFCPYVCKVN